MYIEARILTSRWILHSFASSTSVQRIVSEDEGNIYHPNLQHAFGVYVADGKASSYDDSDESATNELVFVALHGRAALLGDETWEAGLKDADEHDVNITLAIIDVSSNATTDITQEANDR